MILSYSLILLLTAIGFVPIVLEVRRGVFDFFNLKNPFIIYYVIQLGFSGLITLLKQKPTEIGLDPVLYNDYYVKALVLSNLGLISFLVGYYKNGSAINLPSFLTRQWDRGVLKKITLVYFAIGLTAFYILLVVNGGIGQFIADREKFRSGGVSGQGILMFPATSVITVGALVFLIGRIRFQPKSSIGLPLGLVMLSICPAYILGFRSLIALPVLQTMVVYHYGRKAISARGLVVSLSLIMVGFTAYGVSREIPESTSVDVQTVEQLIIEKPEILYAVISRSMGTEVVAQVIQKLEQTGEHSLLWESLFETATILVPKAIWDEKPLPTSQRFTTYFFGSLLADSRGYEMDNWGGISPTIVGELYWHLGYLGTLSGLFCLGAIAKKIRLTLLKNIACPSVLIIYSVFYTTFGMFAEVIQGYLNLLVLNTPLFFVTVLFLVKGRKVGRGRDLKMQGHRG